MKRVYTILIAILAIVGIAISARAAEDFSYTIKWDNPGAVVVIPNMLDDEPMVLPDDATSVVITKTGYTYLRPAKGYIILSVKDQDGKNVSVSGYQNRGGQYVGLSCYSSSNGNEYTVETERLETIGEIELDVVNGAETLLVYLDNKSNIPISTFAQPELKEGKQTVAITKYDTEIVMSNEDGRRQPLHYVKKNGEDVATSQYVTLSIAPGDKIEICTNDPDAKVETCEVTVGFTAGSEGCISNIFNRMTSKMSMWDDVESAGRKLTVYKGDILRFNIDEDFTLKGVAENGKDMHLQFDNKSYIVVVENDLDIVFTATRNSYADVEGIVYIAGPAEGLTFMTGIMDSDVEIPLKGGEEVADDVVFKFSNGKTYTIPGGTVRKYSVTIPGKTKKFFYDAKPGYWISDAVLGNPSDPDYYYASMAVMADNAPLYVKVKKIGSDTKAVVFYDGEEEAARFYAQNPLIPGHIEVDGINGKYLENGYSVISFDSNYQSSFSVGKAGGLNSNEIIAYLDGKKLDYDDDSMSYTGLKMKEGSVLKVFSVPEGHNADLHTVKFVISEGFSADVMYDMVKTHKAPAQLECIGKTLVSVKPSEGASVSLDGELLSPDDEGYCTFTTSKSRHTVTLADSAAVGEIEADKGEDSRIFNLQGVKMNADWESLPAGIYIRGGKKVIKR